MNLRHPLNPNLSLHHTGLWDGYEVQHQHGPLVEEYLCRIKQTLDFALLEHPRTFAVRVDLRLPRLHPYQQSGLMARFIGSLRAQVDADLLCRRREGKRVHDTAVRYVWTCEQKDSDQVHYHVCLFFNKDTYHQIGALPAGASDGAELVDPDVPRDLKARKRGKNLAERIVIAWGRALGMEMEQAVGLVHFPYNCTYRVNARSIAAEGEVAGLFSRISYLAKAKTKQYGMGVRHFGASRG